MAEEIGFENGRNSNFEGLVTLTLTLDPAIRHTVVHHSSTSTIIPNFIQIEETFCGRTDGRTDGHFPPLILLGRLLEVDLKKQLVGISMKYCIPSPLCTGFLADGSVVRISVANGSPGKFTNTIHITAV